MGQNLTKTVCDNAKALLLERHPDVGILARARATGIGKGTVERILNGTAKLDLEVVEKLARNCKVDPWQLCVEGFDPKAPPLLATEAQQVRARLQSIRAFLDAGPLVEEPRLSENGKSHKATYSFQDDDDGGSTVPEKKSGRKAKSS